MINKGTLGVIPLLLIGGVALAAVYKWVDESGRVHYGDAPPAKSDAESVAVPEGPSQEAIERARQQMQEKMERYEKFSEEAGPPETVQEPARADRIRVVVPDNVACFSPLSDVVAGPSADTHTPITPTPLTAAQQKTLYALFGRADARWQGTITDSTCTGSAAEPGSRITKLAARTTVDWDAWHARLTVETDAVGQESHATETLFQRLEVGDALYFDDLESETTIAREGNKVELLALDRNRVSFLIKRHVPVGGRRSAARPRGELRYLEISGKTLKLIELYYHNAMLTGSRTWNLGR